MINEVSAYEKNKGLLGLYESFSTDEEYDASTCMSYSVIKNIHNNPEAITERDKKSDAEWLSFGSLVDSLLTQPHVNIHDKIAVCNNVPSDQFEKIAKYIVNNKLPINKLTNEEVERIYSETGSQVNWKTETKYKKLLEECNSYIDFLIVNQDKIIITPETFNEAVKLAEVLKTHRWSSEFFISEDEQDINNIEIYYQYKIKYIYEGIVCKSKIDIIVVDHDMKLIRLYDLKTGTDSIDIFINHTLYKYGYLYQEALYLEGFQNFINKIEILRDYTIDNFKFLYINRLKPTYPFILQISSRLHDEIVSDGIEHGGWELPSLNELFEEAGYYLKKLDEGIIPTEPYSLQSTYGEKVLTATAECPVF